MNFSCFLCYYGHKVTGLACGVLTGFILISNQLEWAEVMRRVDLDAYRVFPHRAMTTGTVENMMTRVMKPMRITTAISPRGDVYTHNQANDAFFSICICLLLNTVGKSCLT